MAREDDELNGGLDPADQDPAKDSTDQPEPSDSKTELWRLLQDEGHVAGGGKPSHTEAFPAQPEDRNLEAEAADFERWRRGDEDVSELSDAARLRQMIDSPEELDESFDYRTRQHSEVAEEDFDDAVAEFLHAGAAVACRLHPDVDSVQQCPDCQAFYCQACLVVRRGRMLCRDCAEAAYVASEEQILRAQEEGREAPEVDVLPEDPPEFQIGGFGIEGAPAHPLKRILAWLIDIVILRGLLMFLVWLLVGVFDVGAHAGVEAIFDPEFEGSIFTALGRQMLTLQPLAFWIPAAAALDFLYFFFMLSFSNRTFGMSWLGCRIVTEWGEYVGFGTVALRTAVFLVCLQLPALLIAWALRGYRGPHDLAAGTFVINYSGLKRVDAYETIKIRL